MSGDAPIVRLLAIDQTNRSEEMAKDMSKTEPSDDALYYSNIEEALGQHGIPDQPGYIYFGFRRGADVPEDVLDIQSTIENTALTLRELYQEKQPDIFRRIFDELLSATKLLAGPLPNPIVTLRAVERLREKIVVIEGPSRKKQYLLQLGKYVLGYLMAIVVLAIVLSKDLLDLDTSAWPITAYSLLFGCATVAMWVSFAARKQQFSFDDLLTPEGDMMNPSLRIIFVLLLTALLALFAAANVVGVSMGDFSTKNLSTDLISAAIFGAICGLSEKLLVGTVSPHVNRIMSGLGKTTST